MTTHRHNGRIGCAAGREHRAALSPDRPRGQDVSALVCAARRGEERAWSLLVARFGATIGGVARRHGLGEADQDEVAQRTWLRALRHLESLKEPAAIAGWLVATARNESLSVLAARREIPVDEPVGSDAPDPHDVEDHVAARERRAALHQALDRLPARQRSLMRMMLDEPALGYDEIGEALGMPRGSIGPTRGRSLARLRRDPHLAAAAGHLQRPSMRGRSSRMTGHDLV